MEFQLDTKTYSRMLISLATYVDTIGVDTIGVEIADSGGIFTSAEYYCIVVAW